MRHTMSRRLVILAAAAMMSLGFPGCETTVPRSGFPDLAYSHLPPINLAVSRVDVVQQYRPPGKAPNVEHLFPVLPALTAERWARDRLKPAGADGVVRVTVVTASVVEVPLKRTTGIQGMFTTDQSERYDGALEIKVDLVTADGREAASVSSRAERRRTVPENITLLAREKVWFEMTEAMMNDLNASLERQIRENFRRWLVGGGGATGGGASPGRSDGPVQITPLQ